MFEFVNAVLYLLQTLFSVIELAVANGQSLVLMVSFCRDAICGIIVTTSYKNLEKLEAKSKQI